MRSRWCIWGCVLAGACIASRADRLSAQDIGAERVGLWVSGGLGVGSVTLTEGGGREAGLAYDVSAGYIFNPHFMLGAEYAGCNPTGPSSAQSFGALLRYYPSRRSGLYAALAAGVAGRDSSTNLFKDDLGFGWGAGVGYDIRLSPGSTLRPQFFYRALEQAPRTDHWQLNLGVTVYGPILDL